ncbi:MAG: YbaN family protein [Thermoplasmatota archaeon]|nr:YbaN family protein [Candidatus Thermoplasmatota archaeon]MBU1914815.1 YbaN family protein [Candidatus Thermoplasmatota archaeon]
MIEGDSSEPQTDAPSPGISVAQSKLVRLLWNAVGTLFLALGLIGIPLPLLPTTPFLLIAAACYLRGSMRMYNWMMMNRYFGAYLRDYLEGKGLAIKTKVVTLSVLWGVIVFSAVFATESVIVRIGMLAVAIGVTIHLLTLNTKRRI